MRTPDANNAQITGVGSYLGHRIVTHVSVVRRGPLDARCGAPLGSRQSKQSRTFTSIAAQLAWDALR
jgi:hypothetical protein